MWRLSGVLDIRIFGYPSVIFYLRISPDSFKIRNLLLSAVSRTEHIDFYSPVNPLSFALSANIEFKQFQTTLLTTGRHICLGHFLVFNTRLCYTICSGVGCKEHENTVSGRNAAAAAGTSEVPTSSSQGVERLAKELVNFSRVNG